MEKAMIPAKTIPLPKKWPEHIKSAVIHAIALAATAFTAVSGSAATRRSKAARLQALLNKAKHEIALLREEIRLKDARFSRVNPHRRPHYRPKTWMTTQTTAKLW